MQRILEENQRKIEEAQRHLVSHPIAYKTHSVQLVSFIGRRTVSDGGRTTQNRRGKTSIGKGTGTSDERGTKENTGKK